MKFFLKSVQSTEQCVLASVFTHKSYLFHNQSTLLVLHVCFCEDVTQHIVTDSQVHVVTPTQQGDKFSKTPTHNTHTPHIHKPSFQEVGAVTPQLANPVYQAIPAGPGSHPASDSTIPTSSSESTESAESNSSEEVGGSVRAVKPPLNFRYVPRHPQAPHRLIHLCS